MVPPSNIKDPAAPGVAVHTQGPRAHTHRSSARPRSSEAQSGRTLRCEGTSLPARPQASFLLPSSRFQAAPPGFPLMSRTHPSTPP